MQTKDLVYISTSSRDYDESVVITKIVALLQGIMP